MDELLIMHQSLLDISKRLLRVTSRIQKLL